MTAMAWWISEGVMSGGCRRGKDVYRACAETGATHDHRIIVPHDILGVILVMIAGAVGTLRDQHVDNGRGADRKLVRGMTPGTVEQENYTLFLSKSEKIGGTPSRRVRRDTGALESVTGLSRGKRRIAVRVENDQRPTCATGLGIPEAIYYDGHTGEPETTSNNTFWFMNSGNLQYAHSWTVAEDLYQRLTQYGYGNLYGTAPGTEVSSSSNDVLFFNGNWVFITQQFRLAMVPILTGDFLEIMLMSIKIIDTTHFGPYIHIMVRLVPQLFIW